MTEKAKILIVDDRPDKLLALEAVLEELGQEIVRAFSGREALRQVLAQDFAVILLDVNMPDMDGFETASLIRQRKSSEHTPIIFVTAFGDEMHASRGYQLGAVDYILAPVLPEVLRTKVGVFVELYAKTAQVRRQTESLVRRAGQLQKLAAASVAINGAASMERMLQSITDAARDIIGAHQAITLYLADGGVAAAAGAKADARTLSSFSEKYAGWRGRRLRLECCADTAIGRSLVPVRLLEEELRVHADWPVVGPLVEAGELPPIPGMMAAPLLSHEGRRMGIVYVSDKVDANHDGGGHGPAAAAAAGGVAFTADDEAILVQLTQMASIAIENALFAQEREANRLKDEFLATLSHELRTPLNAILGWTQLLRIQGRAGPVDPGEVTHGLEVIERNARSQKKLIEDLLDVSRITSGKMRLAARAVPIGQVVQAAADVVRPAAEAKRLEVELLPDPAAAAAAVFGDPDRLQQVFWNLLSNAVKFTPAGGRITCRLAADRDAARFDVTDTGPGIDAAFLPYVFDRFRQADASSTRAHGGLGIGLTIVRHIVELHGGTVRAASQGPGMGATFTVTLPLARQVAAAALDGNGHADDQPAGAWPQEPAALSSDGLAGLRVLIVDDEPDTREVLQELLNRLGAHVTSAPDAPAALALLRRHRPDVLVSDIAMPGEDGYALIRQVRSLTQDEGGSTPAVALSAYSRDEDRRKALAAGFQAHVAKPVEPPDLLAALVPWLPAATERSAADRTADRVRVDVG
ncbi:MAG TPA: response regulator [Humisphaera sp.]